MSTHRRAHGGISAAFFAAIVCATVGVAGPASADDAVPSCVTDFSTDVTACFDTPAEAEAYAADLLGGAGEGPSLFSAASVALGTIFENTNYGGALWMFVDDTGCDNDPDVDHRRNVMPSGWNDVASSFAAAGSCEMKLWADGYLSGDSYGPAVAAASLGAMNDRTSSVSFH